MFRLPAALLRAKAAFAKAPDAPVDDTVRLARSSNSFAFDVYRLVKAGPGNQVVSPASITTGLAMTWGGARGLTADQMRKVLHLEGDPAAVAQAAGKLSRALVDPARPVVFRVASGLFGEKSFTFEAAFLEATRAAFGAALEPADRLVISRVFHKTFVKVDENGTEAAAATADSMMRVGSARLREEPIVFRADHPFFFLIRDNTSGLVVFMGRVSDPSRK